jgi:predicted polyphosphate/ATP-dependent NAD kinase
VIVNPIAGMGGRVGLKGTDGDDTLARARALGAVPVAPERGRAVRDVLFERGIDTGFVEPTSARGTQAAALNFRGRDADLLLFVGGDGTARDVLDAVGVSIPVLGIPSGVKMHSAVFATGPLTGAEAAAGWLATTARRTRDAEVVDIDEASVRADRMDVRLYGVLRVPNLPGRVQSLKAAGGPVEAADLAALAAEVARRLVPRTLAVLGPGTTTRAVGQALGIETTLLGVDVVEVGPGGARVVAADAGEAAILAAVEGRDAVAVLSPTGGQGFLLGRGNQQFSPAVLRAIGPANLLIAATAAKLAALGTQPLYVDTGDPALDAALAGHRRVITGPGREAVVRIAAG